MVPVRGVFEQLGFNVSWNSSTETATIYNGQITIEIPKGKTYFYVNGQSLKPDVPQQVIGGGLYIPLRAVADSIGASTSWNSENKMVHISYNGYDVYVNCKSPSQNYGLESLVPSYYVYPAGSYGNGVTISFSVFSSPIGSSVGNIIYGDLYDEYGDVYQVGTNIYSVSGSVLDGCKIGITDDKMIVKGSRDADGVYYKEEAYIS